MIKQILKRLFKKYLKELEQEIVLIKPEKEQDYYNECSGIVERGHLFELFNTEVEKSKATQIELCSHIPFKITEAELERKRREGMLAIWEMIIKYSQKKPSEEPYDKHDPL